MNKEEKITTKNMNIALSLEDEVKPNTAWCGTFNLIWNDLKNNLAKQDIVFIKGQPKIVDNLNKGTFTANYLSENSYYKVCDIKTLELKKKIEKDIKDKFNEKSSILDDFEWSAENAGDGPNYFLYAMLKKEFEFTKVFTKLENGMFGKHKNVKYFGINHTTKEEVREQVQVLYYNSEKDFAVKLITKTDDEVILSKGTTKTTFKSIYQEILEKEQSYQGAKYFKKNDILKVPNISFNLKEELKELQMQSFYFSNGQSYHIEKAMQTIEFELNEKGGKIKSEAGMDVKNDSAMIEDKPRKFVIDSTFTIFLKEKGKDLPYFAANIEDISQVQSEVKE